MGDDTRSWRKHFAAQLAALLGADLVIGGELSDLARGRPRSLGDYSWGWDHGFNLRGWQECVASLEHDPLYALEMTNYGLHLRHEDGPGLSGTDLVAPRQRIRTTEYELYRVMGVENVLWCCRRLPASPDDTIGTILCRATGRREFGAREKAIVAEAHALIAPLMGRSLARFTEPSPGDLPARPRAVLRCVLEGDGDKHIAARLGISPHTVNQYLKRIFDHFDVSSRAELLARWVSRRWGARAPNWVPTLDQNE